MSPEIAQIITDTEGTIYVDISVGGLTHEALVASVTNQPQYAFAYRIITAQDPEAMYAALNQANIILAQGSKR